MALSWTVKVRKDCRNKLGQTFALWVWKLSPRNVKGFAKDYLYQVFFLYHATNHFWAPIICKAGARCLLGQIIPRKFPSRVVLVREMPEDKHLTTGKMVMKWAIHSPSTVPVLKSSHSFLTWFSIWNDHLSSKHHYLSRPSSLLEPWTPA